MNQRPNQCRLCSSVPLNRQIDFKAITWPHESIQLWQLKLLDIENKTWSSLRCTEHQAQHNPKHGLPLSEQLGRWYSLHKMRHVQKKAAFSTQIIHSCCYSAQPYAKFTHEKGKKSCFPFKKSKDLHFDPSPCKNKWSQSLKHMCKAFCCEVTHKTLHTQLVGARTTSSHLTAQQQISQQE